MFELLIALLILSTIIALFFGLTTAIFYIALYISVGHRVEQEKSLKEELNWTALLRKEITDRNRKIDIQEEILAERDHRIESLERYLIEDPYYTTNFDGRW